MATSSPSSSSSSSPTSGGSTAAGGTTPNTTSGGTATKTYTGDVAQTRWGPVQVQITVRSDKITNVTVLQQPDGNPRDVEINDYALPILIQDTISAQSANIDMVSGATVTSDGYLRSLQAALDQAGDLRPDEQPHADRRILRRVEHLMGMPVSVALRGRHADTSTGRQAWQAVTEQLREVDRIFSTYRADSVIRRLGRGELTLDQCPPEVADVLELGREAEQQSGGAFSTTLPDEDGRGRLDPSGVVKGWATERASQFLLDLDDTDFCLSAGGDVVCHTAQPDGRGLADRHRAPARRPRP